MNRLVDEKGKLLFYCPSPENQTSGLQQLPFAEALTQNNIFCYPSLPLPFSTQPLLSGLANIFSKQNPNFSSNAAGSCSYLPDIAQSYKSPASQSLTTADGCFGPKPAFRQWKSDNNTSSKELTTQFNRELQSSLDAASMFPWGKPSFAHSWIPYFLSKTEVPRNFSLLDYCQPSLNEIGELTRNVVPPSTLPKPIPSTSAAENVEKSSTDHPKETACLTQNLKRKACGVSPLDGKIQMTRSQLLNASPGILLVALTIKNFEVLGGLPQLTEEQNPTVREQERIREKTRRLKKIHKREASEEIDVVSCSPCGPSSTPVENYKDMPTFTSQKHLPPSGDRALYPFHNTSYDCIISKLLGGINDKTKPKKQARLTSQKSNVG